MLSAILLVSATLLLAGCQCDENPIRGLTFKLTGTDVLFPCSITKNIYQSTGRYVPKNIIVPRIQMKNQTVVACLPRLRPGVPFTLAKFSLKSKSCKVQLEPYSCWNVQEEGNCDAIQNAIDLFLDPVDRLWVLDWGVCNTLEQPIKRCQPKIWCFNYKTGEVVKTINLESFMTPTSSLQFLCVDYTKDGVPFGYVSDSSGAIIVVNLSLGSGFRLILPPEVQAGCVSKSKDILYLQLAHKNSGSVLFLHYTDSPRLFSIKTDYLQKCQATGAIVNCGPKPAGINPVFLGNDNQSGIFFRNKGEFAIYVWNCNNSFDKKNFILVQRGGEGRMATQVVPGGQNLMWIIESNFNDYISGTTGCLGPNMMVRPLVKTL